MTEVSNSSLKFLQASPFQGTKESVPIVLFLDIDGVLNSTRSIVASMKEDFVPGRPDVAYLGVERMAEQDPVAIALIRKLCEYTGAQIIVTSMWRWDHTFDKIAAFFDLPIVGATACSYGIRGLEVVNWLEQHPGTQKWAIVDDVVDGQFAPFQRERIVQTDFNEGLTYAHYLKLHQLLS